MLKYLRYALATFCCAASVGCLALWGRSAAYDYRAYTASYVMPDGSAHVRVIDGFAYVSSMHFNNDNKRFGSGLRFYSGRLQSADATVRPAGDFGRRNKTIYFPLWYPALVFALAGVGILRLGRFTIRSALIATTIVAVLLGMTVVL